MRCHLCAIWAALFDEEPRGLSPDPDACGTCRGDPSLRDTVRRAVVRRNPLLAEAVLQVREPLPLTGQEVAAIAILEIAAP